MNTDKPGNSFDVHRVQGEIRDATETMEAMFTDVGARDDGTI
ncbi:MAG TPA: hypothetical protein VFV55_01705 [Usitatibacteraceae bacterium]|nr:hypothetical protein [Usitatibacteraceae bacterium]